MADTQPMEQVQAIAARVAQLSAAAPPRPDAFRAALTRQLAAAPSPSPTREVTLGEMLRLAATAATAAAGTATASAAAPAAPVAAAPAAAGGMLAPVGGRLSSRFGPRVHPISGERRTHTGVDLAAATGTPIRAAAAGTVSFAGVRGGYGNLVVVDHPGGLQTYYAHASRLDVAAGDPVIAGTVVAAVGSTGMSTGPHLHFEVRRDGTPVDPLGYLPG